MAVENCECWFSIYSMHVWASRQRKLCSNYILEKIASTFSIR